MGLGQSKRISAWDALNVPLQKPVLGHKRTRSSTNTNLAHFPCTPQQVFNISHADFLVLCSDQVNELKRIKLNEKTYTVFESVRTPVMGTSASKECGAAGYVQIDFGNIRNFFVHNNLLRHFPYRFNDDNDECKAFSDFVLEVETIRSLIFPGEVKPMTYPTSGSTNLAAVWHASEGKPPSRTAGTWVSPIRQSYNYSLECGKHFGLIATHEMFWPFFRDCKGNLGIVEGFHWDTTAGVGQSNPCSVVQALVVFTKFAASCHADGRELTGLTGTTPPTAVHNAGRLSSLDFPCDQPMCGHNTECADALGKYTRTGMFEHRLTIPQHAAAAQRRHARAARQRPNARGKSGPRSRTKPPHVHVNRSLDDYYMSDYSTRVRRLIGSGRTGHTELLTYGEPTQRRSVVVKFGCVAKDPDLEEDLEHEANIYSALGAVQGKFVPSFLGAGLDSVVSNLYTLSTTPEGVSVDALDGISEDEISAAMVALDAIHKCGVLHGDVRTANVLVNREEKPSKVTLVDFGMSSMMVDIAHPDSLAAMEQERTKLRNALMDKCMQDEPASKLSI
jgi:hypothetical protein